MAIDSVKSWFGGDRSKTGVLRPQPSSGAARENDEKVNVSEAFVEGHEIHEAGTKSLSVDDG